MYTLPTPAANAGAPIANAVAPIANAAEAPVANAVAPVANLNSVAPLPAPQVWQRAPVYTWMNWRRLFDFKLEHTCAHFN